MKQALILMLFLWIVLHSALTDTFAQRRRTVEFQRDLNTMPAAGKYGISAYQGLPYWISSDSVYLQIQTKPPFIPVWSIGSDREDTLSFYSHLVTVWFDETELWFPPKDSIPDGWYYHISYHGVDTDTMNFEAVDALDVIYFPDSVYFWDSGPQTYRASNYMSADHPDSKFKLMKHCHFQLYWIKEDQRFIITRNKWSDYDY
jgi:hypothetical protein